MEIQRQWLIEYIIFATSIKLINILQCKDSGGDHSNSILRLGRLGGYYRPNEVLATG